MTTETVRPMWAERGPGGYACVLRQETPTMTEQVATVYSSDGMAVATRFAASWDMLQHLKEAQQRLRTLRPYCQELAVARAEIDAGLERLAQAIAAAEGRA